MGLAAKTNESGRIEDDVRILEYIDGEQWVVCSDGAQSSVPNMASASAPPPTATLLPNQAHLGQSKTNSP